MVETSIMDVVISMFNQNEKEKVNPLHVEDVSNVIIVERDNREDLEIKILLVINVNVIKLHYFSFIQMDVIMKKVNDLVQRAFKGVVN